MCAAQVWSCHRPVGEMNCKYVMQTEACSVSSYARGAAGASEEDTVEHSGEPVNHQ